MGRVIINMVTNACYAVDQKRRSIEGGFESFMPTIWLGTERKTDSVEIRIRDNGNRHPSGGNRKDIQPILHYKADGQGNRTRVKSFERRSSTAWRLNCSRFRTGRVHRNENLYSGVTSRRLWIPDE